MTIEPQFLNDNDPACGIGVIEWKVNGSTVPSVDKEALAEAIEDAKKVTEKDKYTAESWEVFETALKEAQKVYDKEDATQEEVDAAVKALKEAQGALVEAEPELEGWVSTENGWEYYEDGQKAVGWKVISREWYYFNENGIMATGWVFVGNHWYYMDQWGAMMTGWVYVDGHYYYMDQWGAMRTGWVQVGNDWYYMNADGAMASNQWIGGYYVDESGKMV